MDYWLLHKLSDGMYEIMHGFGSFWPIYGLVLEELMAKIEVDGKCIALQDDTQSKRKN